MPDTIKATQAELDIINEATAAALEGARGNMKVVYAECRQDNHLVDLVDFGSGCIIAPSIEAADAGVHLLIAINRVAGHYDEADRREAGINAAA